MVKVRSSSGLRGLSIGLGVRHQRVRHGYIRLLKQRTSRLRFHGHNRKGLEYVQGCVNRLLWKGWHIHPGGPEVCSQAPGHLF